MYLYTLELEMAGELKLCVRTIKSDLDVSSASSSIT